MPHISLHQGRVLVPGKSCVGLTFSTKSGPVKQGVFLTGELNLKDYTNIIDSKAVICETAEATSHITVVCRILGVPIVLLERATEIFSPNMQVLVDAQHGRLSQGDDLHEPVTEGVHELAAALAAAKLNYQLSIIDMPELITRVKSIGQGDVDYFFLREEFIWLGRSLHPFRFFEERGADDVTKLLLESLIPLATCLEREQLLNFRSLDLRSDQSNQFAEPSIYEPNPHLGLHGIRQLLRCQDFLAASLSAVDQLYEMGFTNVIYSIPFLTLESELEAVLMVRERVCKNRVKLGIFIETPAAVYELPHLLNHDISVVFVGTKDLTQLILAADRDNSTVADMLKVNSRPVIQAIRTIVDYCSSVQSPVFVFTYLDELLDLRSHIPNLDRVSMPASDYLRVFGG
jgi:phosphoenolpyruvate-protein kinase (PTS system EI component)